MNLIQEKKILTFEEICKNWSLYLSKIKGISHLSQSHDYWSERSIGISLELFNLDRCIVGEAHGFEDSGNLPRDQCKGKIYHGCEKCYDYSIEFWQIHKNHIKDEEHQFESLKERFVNHFNETHTTLLFKENIK